MKKLLLLLSLTLISYQAHSVEIDVATGTCGGTGTAAVCTALRNEIVDAVNADQPDVNIDKYAEGISNATGFSMKGQNSEYAENFTYFVVKPSGGIAVQGEIDDPESAEGFGIGAAITVGLNLDLLPIDKIGPVELNKMDLFVSFMNFKPDADVGDNAEGKGEISSFSVMARYRLVDGNDIIPGYMLEWGGVHLHTGLQRNKMSLELSQSFDDTTIEDSGTNSSGTFSDSVAAFEMETNVTSIPVELSTYLRMAYVFTLYGGLGFDYNLTSETDVDLTASGDFSGSAGDGTTYATTISASESASGDGASTNFRSFVGLQFNVPFVRVYVQANKGLGNDLLGVNAGLKMTY